MNQPLQYTFQNEWITEGSIWRPPTTITLRDEAGTVITSSVMATMLMTIYDLSGGANDIVNNVVQTDVKNTRSCTISSQGVFVLTLLPADTAILNAAHTYERRRVLVEYTWPMTPTKADALEVTVVIRNLARRPYVAP